MGGGDRTIAGRGWSWVAAEKLWLVVGGRGWSHDLVMPFFYDYLADFLKY